jgi:hypothetical protein
LIWSGLVISHQDAPLEKGVQYFYTVAAQNSIGWGLNSSSILVTPFGVPDPPRGLNPTVSDSQVSLSWNIPSYTGSGTLTFHLFRDNVLVWSGTAITHVDTGLLNGQVYSYKVSASNSVGWGTNSTTVMATPFGVPSTPTSLILDEGDSYIRLSWNAPFYPGPGTLIYHLFRNGTLLWSGASQLYNDTKVVNGVTYAYKVAVQNDVGWSANSSVVSAMPISTPSPPDAPIELQASVGDGQVTLTWNAPSQSGSSAITGYRVYRGSTAGSLFLIANVTGTTYMDEGLTNGQAYHYKLSAVSSAGESALSERVVATPVVTNSGENTMVYIGIGAAAILAVAGVAIVMMRRRK